MCPNVKLFPPTFPAVIVGGPPHSGKSVLVYSLTQALRRAGVAHYVLRACPDYEGDWSNEADKDLVQTIRQKGPFTDDFTAEVRASLQKRHLPLLVDVGGEPTVDQRALFRLATHAILLVAENEANPDAYAAQMRWWQEVMAEQRVPVIAQIKSRLQGAQELIATTPLITGVLTGLERHHTVQGPVVTALTERLGDIFAFYEEALAAMHLAQAPAELALDLPALAKTLGAVNGRWLPSHLPTLLDYLPDRVPLALYGRAPQWVYAALALLAYPAPVWLFDARLGWIRPPVLPVSATGELPSQLGWQATVKRRPEFNHLLLTSQAQFLLPDESHGLPLTPISSNKGLVISGRIPNWLLMAVMRQHAALPWLAVYQPTLEGAVVVASQHAAEVGCVKPIARPES